MKYKKNNSISQSQNIDLELFNNLNQNFINWEKFEFFNKIRHIYVEKAENKKFKWKEIHQFFLELDKKFEKISLKYIKNDIWNKILRIILSKQNDYITKSSWISEILNNLKKISNMFFIN